jgi:MoaA/NifB/PqqE/SkfB family radical SAM enzyme
MRASSIDTIRRSRARLAISLHGATPIEHDAVTKLRGSFFQTENIVKAALSYGIPLRIAVIAHADERTTEAAIERARFWGVSDVDQFPIQPVGRGTGASTGTEMYCGACGSGMLCFRWDGFVYSCVFQRERPIARISDLLKPTATILTNRN